MTEKEHKTTFAPKVKAYYTEFFTQQLEQVKMAAEIHFNPEELMMRE